MLGYLAGAFAWGAFKSWAHDGISTPSALGGLGLVELVEEVQFRGLLEPGLVKSGLSGGTARLAQAALFGLAHPGNVIDATLGGILYSKAHEVGGLGLAVLTHVLHNCGVYFGSRSP